jgi:hypothetical protein
MEQLRMDLMILVRLLSGGIVEEVITRWGLMSGLVWLPFDGRWAQPRSSPNAS